ncbi:MAG TPA: histidine kinase [Edaphocola sp.]|nr:histidine kinase [Edaphocola sp.]
MENPVILMFWAGTAVMLLAAVSIILVVALYHNKVRKMQQQETEWILTNTIDTEKKERKRIAADLHDSIGGDLLAISNFLALLDKYVSGKEGKKLHWEVSEILLNSLSNIQRISYNLMPPDIEEAGFAAALREYFSRLRKTGKVTITEVYNGESLLVPVAQQYELFRIVQEATGNLLRHGAISKINFSLSRNAVAANSVGG